MFCFNYFGLRVVNMKSNLSLRFEGLHILIDFFIFTESLDLADIFFST